MKRLYIVVISLLLVGATPSAAQDKTSPAYTIQGQVRHRFENNAKVFNSDTDPVNFNLLRTRLGVSFYGTKHVEAFIQVQDSRVMGEESSTLTDGSADNFDLHQGYIKITDLFNGPVDIQLGRFEVNYGSQRLIGAVGWHNIGRSFDGGIVRIRPKGASIDVFNLKVVEMLEPGGVGDLNVMGFNGDVSVIENFKTQAFIILQKSNPTTNLNRYTAGVFISGATGNFKPEFEFAYQGGTRADIDVAAFMATLNMTYTVASSSLQPAFTVGIDYLSGDDDQSDDTYKVFDTLYATNHKFYGYMDYFLNIPTHTLGLGLSDIHAKVAVQAHKDVSVRLAFHTFMSNADFVATDGSTSTSFGNEVDLTVVYKYTDRLSFTGGASVFAPGEIFKATRGEDLGTWAYVSTIVNL